MDSLITFAAKYLILLPFLVNFYIFWKLNSFNRKKMIILGISGAVLSFVLAKTGSHLYANPRPAFKDHAKPLFEASDYNGFPSDHTLLAAWLGFLALAFSKKTGLWLLAVSVLVGWSRVAAHVHHAVDVIGSLLITALVYLVLVGWLKLGPAPEHPHSKK
jgi:undecaprenyl-diphosphatase